jgi:hypothetical protein
MQLEVIFRVKIPVRDAITMDELKKRFYLEFLDADWKTGRLIELMEIRYLSGEAVKEYTQRFASLMQSSEFSWSDTHPERQFLKHILFYKTSYSVQRIIGEKKVGDYPSGAALPRCCPKYVTLGVQEYQREFLRTYLGQQRGQHKRDNHRLSFLR